ncbi:hypothetical protein BB559_004743 [Furculomyces boomerangus]|uniref:Uncharacterized protein n=2 Tax=Harpellales TaxID=61421 RepID=A0A2T9YCU7_9FUNG|nr:hypothetical protein BB559_004743 [Furculomyces boomerangus]PVZ99245.1 hypothetical protein BB558_004732 [Smittium angustum]
MSASANKRRIEEMLAEKKAAIMQKFSKISKNQVREPVEEKTNQSAGQSRTSTINSAQRSIDPSSNTPTSTSDPRTTETGVFSNKINLNQIQNQIAAAKAQAQLKLQSYMNSKNATRGTSNEAQTYKVAENEERNSMNKRTFPETSMQVLPKSKKQRNLALLPKFSTIKINQSRMEAVEISRNKREVKKQNLRKANEAKEIVNPYLEHLGTGSGMVAENFVAEIDPNVISANKMKKRKGFQFVKQGTYSRIAEEARSKARLEEMKKKIAERVKKAGLELEIKESEAVVLTQKEPPEMEWWDAPLLQNTNYKEFESYINQLSISTSLESLSIPVTHYIQHPIPIDMLAKANQTIMPKKLMLTQKEHKKLRRQRRQELLKDKREKIQMGLLPPEKPKVRLSNLMRVMGSQAIQDPTKMEAMARSQMKERLSAHVKANTERKLTKEAKHAKILEKSKRDENLGIYSCVFKILSLDNSKLRYKVNINAKQLNLAGVCLIYPRFSLVVVEGGMKAVRQYKKLMQRRINWTEPILDFAKKETINKPGVDGKTETEIEGEADDAGLTAKIENNKCDLVWEGQMTHKNFKSFKVHICPSESIAKGWLSSVGLESYWDTAATFRNSNQLVDDYASE